MEKTNSKKKWNKIIAISLAVIVVLGLGVWGLLSLFNHTKFSPNWELAAKLKTRATNAQYLPESSKLVGDSDTQLTVYGYSNSNNYFRGNSMTIGEYNKLIRDIGSIWHPYQGDFNIHDVRDIVIYMSENVGIFDQWFRYRGTNRSGADDDFENIPKGLADGDFYMSFDEETEHFKIIQCMSFQPWVWDSDTNEAFWNGGKTPDEDNYVTGPSSVNPSYRNNWPAMSEEVLIINYYYIGEGEDRKEVVEAEIIEFLHVYNQTIINGYQKLKNIQDTSFTRYEVNCTKTINAYGYGAIDYKNAVETGVKSKFLQIDYTNYENVSILELQNSIESYGEIEYNAIVNGTKTNFTSSFEIDNQKQVYNASREEEMNISYVKDSFVSLLNSLTGSDELSSNIDFTNTSINVYEQNIINNLNLAINEVITNSYLKHNYEQGLNIWNREAEDVTDKIHKPDDLQE